MYNFYTYYKIFSYITMCSFSAINIIWNRNLNLNFLIVPYRVFRCAIFPSFAGLDSTFGGLEAMVTALCDEYPRLLRAHREIFVAVLLIGVYICALPTTTYVSTSAFITAYSLFLIHIFFFVLYFFWKYHISLV